MKRIASMADAAADIDVEHGEAVAAAGMHLQAASSGGDVFKVLPLPCQHCLRGMKGIVTAHRATDPRLVTVSLQMAVDVDTEEQTKLVLYSVLRDSGLKALRQERARIMQDQIEGLLFPQELVSTP